MPCEEIRQKIEAYLDKELTLSDRRVIEEHLAQCSRCSAMFNNLHALSTSIKKIDYTSAPIFLRRKIKSGLKEMTGEGVAAFNWYHLLGAGVGSAVFASLFIGLVMTSTAWSPLQFQPTDELIAAHVRSMMASHVTDIDSSDRHTVKPWFNGKLDFSPMVLDLQEHGFHLVGGRLDYLQKQPVAALVYKRRAHIINVFIRRGGAEAQPARYAHQQGYNLVHWRKEGLDYALVSDLNEKEVQQLVGLLENQRAPK